MALEAVVCQQDGLFSYSSSRELHNLLGVNWGYDDFGSAQEDRSGGFLDFLDNQTETSFLHGDQWNSSPPSNMLPHFNDQLHQITNNVVPVISPDDPNNSTNNANNLHRLDDSPTVPVARPKRRRSRSRKNKEEIENQRMTHIAVERNRRKQMNEYLSVLRSLMPESYVQRGDQASIIGGAINFVKELEQRLQLLGAHKEMEKENSDGDVIPSMPFSEFFTFPQYSTNSSAGGQSDNLVPMNEAMSQQTHSTIADIEVTMVESHANLKIRSKRRPKQLLKVVSGLHSMRLTILHLNVTTIGQVVLYCLSVKVEDDCKLTSVDEIATAVYQMLGRIQQESALIN